MVDDREVAAEAERGDEWRRRVRRMQARARELVGEASDRLGDGQLGSAVADHPYRAMAAGMAAGWILGRLVRG